MTGNQHSRAGVLAFAVGVGAATIVGGLLRGRSPPIIIGAALAVASPALSGAPGRGAWGIEEQ